MKLPDIEYATPVQGANVRGQYEALAGLGDTIAKGLQMYGQEMIRTQMQKANVDLARGLSALEQTIESKPTFTTQEVKDLVGDIDSLPPDVRSQLTDKALDVQTGQMVEMDRNDIPSWVVAGHIFDAGAQKLLGASSQGITADGWKAEFQDKAAEDVLARKVRMNGRQLEAMNAYFIEEQTQNAIELANAGEFKKAFEVVSGSPVMDQKYKAKLNAEITKTQDLKPVFDADRNDDYGEMASLIGQLNDPSKFTSLSPQEREKYASALKGRIKEFQTAARLEQERRQQAYDDNVSKTLYVMHSQGKPLSLKMIPLDVSAKTYKALQDYIEQTRNGQEVKTDFATYANVYERIKNGMPVNLTDYIGRIGRGDLEQLLKLQLDRKQAGGAYDKFQSTDEAINAQLRGIPGIDLGSKEEKDQAEVGWLKSVIQHEMAAAQRNKGGNDLTVEERDAVITNVIKREIDPKKGWFSSTSMPAQKIGVPAQMVPVFRSAVTALAGAGILGDPSKPETLERAYEDYRVYEPEIERGWMVTRGANILPGDSVRVWYYLNANLPRLKAQLKQTGGATGNRDEDNRRLVHMAIFEINNTPR